MFVVLMYILFVCGCLFKSVLFLFLFCFVLALTFVFSIYKLNLAATTCSITATECSTTATTSFTTTCSTATKGGLCARIYLCGSLITIFILVSRILEFCGRSWNYGSPPHCNGNYNLRGVLSEPCRDVGEIARGSLRRINIAG